MTTIGFTGARETTPIQAAWVRDLIAGMEAGTYVTGACTGVDEAVARAVAGLWPDARNVILVPANRSCISPGFLTAMGRVGAEIVPMAPGTDYRDRNQAIVDLSDRLVGIPPFREDHPACRRSGTWQTIRMARRACLRVDVHILTEECP